MVEVAVLGINLNAFEVFLHDEVDDARNGVRTVHGRCAAGQNVNAVDELAGDEVEVSCRVVRRAVRHALAVDQDQRAGRAEVTQRDRRGTRGAVGNRRVLRSESLRQLDDEVFNARDALKLDVFRRHRRDRAGGRQVGLEDARTGNGDALLAGFGISCRRFCRGDRFVFLRNGRCDCSCDKHRARDHRRHQKTCLQIHFIHRYGLSQKAFPHVSGRLLDPRSRQLSRVKVGSGNQVNHRCTKYVTNTSDCGTAASLPSPECRKSAQVSRKLSTTSPMASSDSTIMAAVSRNPVRKNAIT